MTERNPSLWLQNRTDHTAENDRALLTSLFGGREGVSGASDLAVSQRAAGANMSVDVAIGRAAVLGDDAATTQGVYHVWNDAVKNLTIAASDPTNPRKDIVIARVRDAFYSGATNAWALEVVSGTPAASPAEPALPNNAIKLAVVAIAASATSIVNANITDARPRAAALSAPIVCTASTRPGSPYAGMQIFETDTGKALTYDGSGWCLPKNVAGGEVDNATITTPKPSGIVGSEVNISGFNVTTVATSHTRKYRITVDIPGIFSTVAGDVMEIFVRNGATTVLGRKLITAGSSSNGDTGATLVIRTTTAAVDTFQVSAQRAAGSGSMSIETLSDRPATMLLEDTGGV